MRPADLEGALIPLLRTAVAPVSVSTRVPSTRPVSFVRVNRVGGGRQNLAQESATVLVECWAADSVAALDLASKCYGAIDDAQGTLLGSLWLAEASLSSPVNFPDPETTSPRYQFTGSLVTNLQES